MMGMNKNEKFKSKRVNYIGLHACILIIMLFSLISIKANAGIIFYDDFEDGDLNLGTQWYLGGTGTGSSTTNVVGNPGLRQGHLRQVGAGATSDRWTWGEVSVGRTFAYAPGLNFEFDMRASSLVDTGAGGRAGVDFQFLNALGTPIDSYGIMYSTSALSADRYATIADTSLHPYSFSVEDLMSIAGLTPSQTAQVRSVFMKFEVGANRYRYSALNWQGIGEVWFDNVSVSSVPEPATLCLLGLGSLACMRKRRF